MRQDPAIILISGTSHVGKSTLAGKLARTLGWKSLSTDSLARHPGRPWPAVRREVAEFYEGLGAHTIHWFLKVHHENLWPRIRTEIEAALQAGTPLVIEGAALRPEYVATLEPGRLSAVLLHADDAFLRARMLLESGHAEAAPRVARLIETFIERSLRDNRDLLDAARATGLRCVDAGVSGALETLAEEFAARAGR